MSAEQISQIRRLGIKQVEQERAESPIAASIWDTWPAVARLKFLFLEGPVINKEECRPQTLKYPLLHERITQYLHQPTRSTQAVEQETPASNQTECWGVLSKLSTFQAALTKAIKTSPTAEQIPVKRADGTLDTVYTVSVKPGLTVTLSSTTPAEGLDTIQINHRRPHRFANGCVETVTDVISLFPDGSFVVKVDYHPGNVKTQSYGGSANTYRLNNQSSDTDLKPDVRAIIEGIETTARWCLTELSVNRSSDLHERM